MDRKIKKSIQQNYYNVGLFTFLVGTLLTCSSFLYAEESVSPPDATESPVNATLEQFDSGALHQALKGRIQHLKEKMEQLKSEDPARYEATMNSVRGKRLNRLSELAEKDPERFKEVVARKEEKLSKMLEKNPEHHQQILEQKQKHRRKHLQQLKENNPEVFEKLQNTPGETLRDRLKYVKQTDPELAKHMHHLAQQHKEERFEHRKDEIREKWQNATSEERHEWAKNHPKAVQHLKERRVSHRQSEGVARRR